LNTWIAGWQKPEEQLTCPLCREPILPKWKASPLYTKIRKETSSKIGEGQWYKPSTPEEFKEFGFRLNALLWHPIYYKEFIPLFTGTLIILLTNNLADDTLEALDRSLSIIEGVVRFIVPGLEFDDRGEAQRKANRPLKDLEKDLELTRRYYELKDWVEKVSKGGYDWSPGEVKNMCQCAQMLLLDIAYTYDDVTGGRNNDLDGQVAKVEFLDNNELRYRIKNRKKCAISNERWFSECASVVDALGRGKGKYNKWLMDRAKILNKERKKYLTKLKAANKLRMESNQSLEYVKQVKTLERYHKKLAGACNEVDVSEHKERKDNKRPMDRAKIMKKERKEPLTKQKRNKLCRKPNQSPEY
jgi:hypothetical protein